jgi:hypothetical protein
MGHYRLTLAEQIRDKDMLLMIDGHQSCSNLTAAFIF